MEMGGHGTFSSPPLLSTPDMPHPTILSPSLPTFPGDKAGTGTMIMIIVMVSLAHIWKTISHFGRNCTHTHTFASFACALQREVLCLASLPLSHTSLLCIPHPFTCKTCLILPPFFLHFFAFLPHLTSYSTSLFVRLVFWRRKEVEVFLSFSDLFPFILSLNLPGGTVVVVVGDVVVGAGAGVGMPIKTPLAPSGTVPSLTLLSQIVGSDELTVVENACACLSCPSPLPW